MRPTRLREGGLITQPRGSNVNLTEAPVHTPRVKFDQMSGHSVAQSSWHTQLAMEASHCISLSPSFILCKLGGNDISLPKWLEKPTPSCT